MGVILYPSACCTGWQALAVDAQKMANSSTLKIKQRFSVQDIDWGSMAEGAVERFTERFAKWP